MIPRMNIIAWGSFAPWAEPRQIEQDLIISRAIIDIFSVPSCADNSGFAAGRL